MDRQAGVTAPLHIESYSEFANKYIHAREWRTRRAAPPRRIPAAFKIEIVFANPLAL